MYDPSGHDVILFGGYGAGPPSFLTTYYQDTWSFAGHTWTPLIQNSTCTPTTCPSPRAGAMIAYYPADNALVLFGGFIYTSRYVDFNDTWLFANGAWQNITGMAGAAPSPRSEGAMSYDPSDNYVLLFGGATAAGSPLGDTWTFSNGRWTNITSLEGGVNGYTTNLAPEPRAGAAIADSPSGYVLLFGGTSGYTIIENDCAYGHYDIPGTSSIGWWFYQGKWSLQAGWGFDAGYPGCAPHQPTLDAFASVRPSAVTPRMTPPCGRVNPALGWSPKNERFVVYGGVGPPKENVDGNCTGTNTWLNDTWISTLPVGGGSLWRNAGDSGDPPWRTEAGYASDFTDGYFLVFGGTGNGSFLNDTWRFFELVHAQLTGPSDIDTGGSNQFAIPFDVVGYGGSGDLTYQYSIHSLRSLTRTLSGTGCLPLTAGPTTALPYDGTASNLCAPTPTSYNIYRLTVSVKDVNNATNFATANWTFTVTPPEGMAIYSQFKGDFYSGVTFPDKLGLYAEVAGQAAVSMSATLGGFPFTFTQRSSDPKWWDATIDMGLVTPGTGFQATAQFGDWTQNATFNPIVVQSPDWLLSILLYPDIHQAITTKGAGPYNESFSISETFSWSLDKALGFNIKIPLAGGNYSLIPALKVVFTAGSSGNISLAGTLSLTPPKISIGPADLTITAAISLKGTFALALVGPQITGVKWLSATATISVSGKFSGSIPLYGFEIFGVKVGFTLEVEVDPSVTIGMVLVPTTPGFEEFISGIQAKVQSMFASFTLPLSVAVNFGIGIASIGIGGTIGIALSFRLNPGITLGGGWVNGSFFVEASAFWWSDQWDIVSGTIYTWTNPPAAPLRPSVTGVGYNDGTNTTWVVQTRYYTSGGYDANVWKSTSTSGPAITDIYPHTEVSGAAAYDGAYLFYTNDNPNVSAQQGIGVSGLRLDSDTNGVSGLPSPSDPGFILSSPQSTRLPDGSLYVLWDALPAAEESLSGPTGITALALHGAHYFPGNHSWGPVHAWTTWGLAQSYLVDATDGGGHVAALVTPGFAIGEATPERLVSFNLTTGQEDGNSSLSGIAKIVSLRSGTGAIVESLGGNFTTIALDSGTVGAIGTNAPSGYHLLSAAYAVGSRSSAVLLYRGQNDSLLVLYDLAAHATIGSLPLGQDVSEAQAVGGGGAQYVFVRTSEGIDGWSESGGTFQNLSAIPLAGVVSYSLVQDGGSVLVCSLTSRGNSTQPIVSLNFAEIGASALPLVSAPPTSTPSSRSPTQQPNYLLYLAAVAGAVVVLLAVVAVVTRRRPPSPATARTTSPEAPSPSNPREKPADADETSSPPPAG
ncbi:MAG: kelch motif-containing protein [Thermoplasmata archaeon]|nr:kelch motif-containing protein [Thermoplasmata archaeon]MCI4359755.1 kelch motif-containing protein [Thermoplasmata archaeon]